jgi:hypothetical protein
MLPSTWTVFFSCNPLPPLASTTLDLQGGAWQAKTSNFPWHNFYHVLTGNIIFSFFENIVK